jgi:ketosteroid isomerase-like protein
MIVRTRYPRATSEEEVSEGLVTPEEVVRQLWDAINARDYARLADAIADRCMWSSIGSGRTFQGPAAVVDGLRRFHDAFPDGRAQIIKLLAVEDTVVIEWRVTGTNIGSYEGHKPTLRKLDRRGCSVAEVRGEKIVAYRDYFDRLTLREQLGLS